MGRIDKVKSPKKFMSCKRAGESGRLKLREVKKPQPPKEMSLRPKRADPVGEKSQKMKRQFCGLTTGTLAE